MKKGWALLAVGSSALFLVVLMSFSQRRYAAITWQKTQLYWENTPSQTFLTGRQVREALGQMYPTRKGTKLKEINMVLLEEKLENHPSIKRAEVFSKLEGTLCIRIWQHQPLARVHSQDQRYYLLAQGAKMPLSPHYAAAVPLITGTLPDTLRPQVARFVQYLQDQAYFRDFFTGIHLAGPHQVRLYPRAFSHEIRLGRLQHYPEKLEKLKLFYQTIYFSSPQKDLQRIDLRFEDQVVCQ